MFQSQSVISTADIPEHHIEHSLPVLSVKDVPDYVYNHAQTYFDSSMLYLVEPLHYEVTIELVDISYNGPKQFTFKGKVEIVLHARQELDSLVLGAKDLRIEKLALRKLKNYVSFVSGNITRFENCLSLFRRHTFKRLL